MITAQELRQKYLKFFESKGHTIIPSASLIPENDPTVLFTTAGMHPLVPYLLGEEHPGGKRLTSCQKCIRTGDIDEVGDDVHLTFFEMLGNWSLGDYWKKEAIEWSFEFLTKELGLSKDKLAISCFEGEKKNNIERDDESAKLWQSQGIPKERIVFLGKDDNWWGPAGQTGPCGSDTEMFYWAGEKAAPKVFDPKDKRWVEIWNDVFMEYNRLITKKGEEKNIKGEELLPEDYYYESLKQKNVDTGMGMERTLAVLNDKENIYETELFFPIIEKIEALSGKKYQENKKEFRIIADHIKASTFIIAGGIEPSNVQRGYSLRRLIRRAIRYGRLIGIKNNFIIQIAEVIIEMYKNIYLEPEKDRRKIFEELKKEEDKFFDLLRKIETRRNKRLQIINRIKNGRKEEADRKWLKSDLGIAKIDILDDWDNLTNLDENNRALLLYDYSAAAAFALESTYGYPHDMFLEDLKIKLRANTWVDKVRDVYIQLFIKHQELSRTASAGMFKGGLADNSEIVVKYHTTTHLLHQALREVLGEHVAQKGSNITAERLRFDFSHPTKMTPEEIAQVEKIVNEKIEQNLPVHFEMLSVEEAKARGAIGLFEDKYAKLGNQVKVYFVGEPSAGSGRGYSAEICGGPHVEHTGKIGSFKIIKEEAVAAGVRRIKAVLK
ncbi:MAG: alanine--tRNA ligase-related protein [Patescibacteria group bacterium]